MSEFCCKKLCSTSFPVCAYIYTRTVCEKVKFACDNKQCFHIFQKDFAFATIANGRTQGNIKNRPKLPPSISIIAER